MSDQNLETALTDLVDAIRGITLGSVEDVVIDSAAKELIRNWNDHNEEKIDVDGELAFWDECKERSGVRITTKST